MPPGASEIDIKSAIHFQGLQGRYTMAGHWPGMCVLAFGLQFTLLMGFLLFPPSASQTLVAARVRDFVFGPPFNLLWVVFLVTVCFYWRADVSRLAQWSVIAPVMLASHVAVGELFAGIHSATSSWSPIDVGELFTANRLGTDFWSPFTFLILQAFVGIGAMLASAYAAKVFVCGKAIPSGPIRMWHLLGFVVALGTLLISVKALHVVLQGLPDPWEPAEGLEAALRQRHLLLAVYRGLNCAVIATAVLIMVFLIMRNASWLQRMAGLAALGVWIVFAFDTAHIGATLLPSWGGGSPIWVGVAAVLSGALSILYAKYVVARLIFGEKRQ